MVNKPLIRPYSSGGFWGGGTLTSHEWYIYLVVEPTQVKNMLVKLDHFPRGENKKYETNT